MLRLTQRCDAVRRCERNGSFHRYLATPCLCKSGQSDHYAQNCDEWSDTTESASVASEFAGHGRPPVPRKSGALGPATYLICIRVPNLPLNRTASGEAVSMGLREL